MPLPAAPTLTVQITQRILAGSHYVITNASFQFFVVGIVIALSCMAGIGGGGIVVPLCMVFFSLETKEAVAISGFCILLCSILRFIYNFKTRHPEKDAVSIDYAVASVMLPTVLIGSLIGVNLN
mmetsp:Transcript_39302/g.29020  ORF Transcript_39302/g.29020 Transcript_39302/m.29020 type:complete len:124 (-) Transcript_39302:1211-1582(-)